MEPNRRIMWLVRCYKSDNYTYLVGSPLFMILCRYLPTGVNISIFNNRISITSIRSRQR